MAKKSEPWRSFEDAFRHLIETHKEIFGLEEVEPKPGKVPGKSGNTWNIEVIAYTKGERKIVIFECRRKTTRNLEPEEVGGFAYRIEDIGAAKGYLVTPLNKGLSVGAKKIVKFNQIGHVRVSLDSKPEEFIMGYLNNIFLGVTEHATVSEEIEITIT